MQTTKFSTYFRSTSVLMG